MTRRWWKWLLIVGIVVPLLALGFDRLQKIYWVGSTDLDIEFIVTGASSSDPVPGARVEVHSEGGFYDERDKQEFALVTNADGVARKVCHDSMCSGTQSGLRFTDTYAVHLPWWWFRVIAPGYEPSEWLELDVTQYREQVQRTGPQRARLAVSVSLQKSHP
jgi:hypothetical protein